MLYLTEAILFHLANHSIVKSTYYSMGAFSSSMLGLNDADAVAIAYSNATGTAAFLLVGVQSFDNPPAHIPEITINFLFYYLF